MKILAFPSGDSQTYGMTLRDYFAAAAMQALVADLVPDPCAAMAYQYADAMLLERNKT